MSGKMDVLAWQNTSTGECMHNPEKIFLDFIAQRESNGNSLLVNNVASSKSLWTKPTTTSAYTAGTETQHEGHVFSEVHA